MEYMSLDPISLALGDKTSTVEGSDAATNKIDTEEGRDKVRSARLVEKLKLHTVVKHVPDRKSVV